AGPAGQTGRTGTPPTAGTRPTGAGRVPGGAGGGGGILGSSTPNAALTAALQADAGTYTWVAATIGANQAAGYQLASGEPVMAVGGFNGTDPWPTLAVFEQYVADGEIHFFISGGNGGGGGGGSSSSNEIANWVQSNFTASTIGGSTVYDLSTGAAS
ncbi:MAG: glycosyl transferase family 39, partial [Ilumatobacteraceae bacterium]|nr:glycosyl transferase family 39 [Ilumatobacteraceae bacterium]